MASDRYSYRFFWARQPMIHGFCRKVLLGLGQDLYLQVRWRPKPDYCVSLIRQIRCIVTDHPQSWGQSAGSLSISTHILTNPTSPPFKAAIMVRASKFQSPFRHR